MLTPQTSYNFYIERAKPTSLYVIIMKIPKIFSELRIKFGLYHEIETGQMYKKMLVMNSGG